MALISVSNNALQNITAVPASVASGALILLSTQTASSSASISFTSGIDSTYDSYVFKFINIHPATDGVSFHFQGSTNSGSTYGITTTTTAFRAAHNEAGADAFGYLTAQDLAQSTSDIFLLNGLGNENDQNLGGTLTLFNPSSTVFVKHFIARTQGNFNTDDYSLDFYSAGYFNTTSAINAVQFKMSSGNIDDGIIKLYGVK